MGNITRIREIPADFKLASSYRSPKFPITITDEIKIAIGNAQGIKEILLYKIISKTSPKPAPFPTISSTYTQINCINKTNNAMKKVVINGPINCFIKYLSIVFKSNISIKIYFSIKD